MSTLLCVYVVTFIYFPIYLFAYLFYNLFIGFCLFLQDLTMGLYPEPD